MVDWRTLGEVPDSEDEDGFDSLGTEDPVSIYPAIQTTTSDHDNTSTLSTAQDIWDVPVSPDACEVGTGEVQTEKTRSELQPLQQSGTNILEGPSLPQDGNAFDRDGAVVAAHVQSAIPTTPGVHEMKDIWEIPSSQEEVARRLSTQQPQPKGRPQFPHPTTTQTTPLSSLPPQAPSSQDLPSIEQIVAEGPIHESHTPKPAPSRNETPVSKSTSNFGAPGTSAGPTPELNTARTPLHSQILGHDTEHEEAQLVAARYERSLRARKPEQLHPYAMEMARFNRDWTKSGLRPMRLANTEAERRRRDQEDSQENDFEPESQGSNNNAEDNHVNDSGDFMEGLMVTGLSSSPMQTSPLDDKGPTSSQMSSQPGTDNTSLDDDDDELPTIEQLARRRKPKTKRRRSPSRSLQSKRRRIANLLDSSPIRPTPSRLVVRQESPDPLGLPPAAQHSATLAATPSERRLDRSPSQGPEIAAHRAASPEITDPFASDGESHGGEKEPQVHVISDDGPNDSRDSSDNSSDNADTNRVRIRGVLPASWLRIDQQTGRSEIRKKFHRAVDRSPDRENRRGVAQRRQAVSHTAQDRFLFSESEDEAGPMTDQRTTDESFPNQTRLVLQPRPNPPAVDVNVASSDDDGSVVEEDHIDRMVSGGKRQVKLSDAFGKVAKQLKTRNDTKAVSRGKRNIQPKISRVLNKTGGSSTGQRDTSKKRTKKVKQGGRASNQDLKRYPRATAPQLSVLDVIESDAPQFLRIAARTAKSRQNQGRASPTKKTIQLATRQDYLDAAEILGNWRRGAIQQRETVTAAQYSRKPCTRPQTQPEPTATRRVSSLGTAPKKFTKQVSDGGRIRFQAQDARPTNSHSRSVTDGRGDYVFQPAQLQTEASFQFGKTVLDRLYQRRGKKTSTAESTLLPVSTGRTRRRKKSRPQQIDVGEPRYACANDPIPCAQSEQETIGQHTEGGKLLGLGPYGTYYTQHFDVFPLTPGIYFHDSTLLGSGMLEGILHEDYRRKLQGSGPKAILTLGEQMLSWGAWNAQVSSELGVVFDYVSEQMEKPAEHNDLNPQVSVGAADHLLSYATKCITFESNSDVSSFLARSVEVVQGFINRLPTNPAQATAELFQICDRVGLFAFITLRISCSDPVFADHRLQVEDLVRSLAVATAKLLSTTSSNQLRQTYGKLIDNRARERGLSSDDHVIHSWTLMLRILENASIPRGSFWDVAQKVLLSADSASSISVHQQERTWEDFFTLLPLTDFTDSGVVVAGGRQRAVTDGWAIPQKLLNRVFQLYRDNQRQSPGFNSYCRAIVARCHYLVQHWGWRKKSSGVAGVIFDFFGSQSLAHLRNEEFFSSPRFLENLPNAPPLKIESEDRCFHIFLKLLASSIMKLREDESTKDIRNLVARTMPNHSRQYSKVQTIHQRDLAALRNHHDLLVTLYWTAPPHLRPHPELLERLVFPASSHKEACLINIRAWNQLARFVISTGATGTSGEAHFAPFYQWRHRFFQQMVQQLETVASDIQQQLVSMSTDITKSISPDMIDSMISMNKAGIMDVIHLSMTASLDVMKHAPDLEAAYHALSDFQLQRVFSSFAVSPPEMDWAILRIALATLDTFLSRIDEFEDSQESQQSESQILDSALGDDALLVLDEKVASNYFSMARCVLASSEVKESQTRGAMDRFDCTEQAIKLGARITAKFISAGVMTLKDLFKPGKYRLFGQVPYEQGLEQRKFLTLFVTTLLEHGCDDIHDTGFTLQELYMSSLVKPQESLAYENRLADQLIRHKNRFVPETARGLVIGPDYGTNRQLFEFGIDYMRKSVRDAGPSARRDLVAEHSETLRHIMTQIQRDLRATVNDRTQHRTYVSFVQSIISLIKAHGPGLEFRSIDGFFFQRSMEYWPPAQDLQYSVAGMTAYGLRVVEGDTRVELELFYFLLERFKLAMMANEKEDEAHLLAKGLQHPGILKFILGSMLPAIIGGMAYVSTQVLLDVYRQALDLFLDCEDECFVLEAECIPQIQTTLGSILQALWSQKAGSTTFANEDLHVLRQLIGLMNLLWPSVYTMLLRDCSTHPLKELDSSLAAIRAVTARAEIHLGEQINTSLPAVNKDEVLGSLPHVGSNECDPTITNLQGLIVGDIRKNWVFGTERITLQAHPQATQSTQSAQGVEVPVFDPMTLVRDLYTGIKEWNRWWRKAYGTPKLELKSCQEVLLF